MKYSTQASIVGILGLLGGGTIIIYGLVPPLAGATWIIGFLICFMSAKLFEKWECEHCEH